MSSNVQFFLTRSAPCPACDGTGKKHHPNRQKWLDWKAAGKSRVEFFNTVSKTVWPPEELEKPIRNCSECNGTGQIRSECSLFDALSEMGQREIIV